jgi:hypothetical protein
MRRRFQKHQHPRFRLFLEDENIFQKSASMVQILPCQIFDSPQNKKSFFPVAGKYFQPGNPPIRPGNPPTAPTKFITRVQL